MQGGFRYVVHLSKEAGARACFELQLSYRVASFFRPRGASDRWIQC